MTTVDKHNYQQFAPEVIEHIKTASFICLDTEFTGLTYDHPLFPTSFQFDSNQTLYERMAFVADHFQLLQVGLGIFKKDESSGKYKEYNYSFLMHPSDERPIMMNSSSVSYLTTHGFEFAKCFGNGMHCSTLIAPEKLDAYHARIASKPGLKDLEKLMTAIDAGENTVVLTDPDALMLANEKADELKSKGISIAGKKKAEGWTVTIKRSKEKKKEETPKEVSNIMEEKKIEEDEVEEDEESPKKEEPADFLPIFKALFESKVPVVGHCCLFDWLYLYATCYDNIPQRFTDFASWMLSNFPQIWDTKYLIHQARKFDQNIPSRLEQAFNYFKGITSKPELLELAEFSTSKPHDAGFDASMTGYVFVYLLSIISSQTTLTLESSAADPNSHQEHSNIYQMVKPDRTANLRDVTGGGEHKNQVIVCQLNNEERSTDILETLVEALTENFSLKVLKVNSLVYYLWLLDAEGNQTSEALSLLRELHKENAKFSTFDQFEPVKINHMWIKRFGYI